MGDPAEPDDVVAAGPGARRRARAALAVALGVVAVVGVPATAVALWVQASLFDTDRVVATVDDVLAAPAVRSAVAEHLTDELAAAVSRAAARSDRRLDTPVGVLLDRARPLARARIEAGLGRDRTATAVSSVVGRSHRAAVALVRGDPTPAGVTVEDGRVRLNLLPVVVRGLGPMADRGLLGPVELPDLAADGDPAEQVRLLEAALGLPLPPSFGQLVVYRDPVVAEAGGWLPVARRAVVVVDRLVWVLPLVTVAAGVGAVALARRRRRAVGLGALAVAVALLALRVVVVAGTGRVPRLVADPGRTVLATTLDSLADPLVVGVTALAGAALVVAATAAATAVARPRR